MDFFVEKHSCKAINCVYKPSYLKGYYIEIINFPKLEIAFLKLYFLDNKTCLNDFIISNDINKPHWLGNLVRGQIRSHNTKLGMPRSLNEKEKARRKYIERDLKESSVEDAINFARLQACRGSNA